VPPPHSFKDFERLEFEKATQRVHGLPGTVPSGTMTAFVRKFLTIGLFDHHVLQEQRLHALKLAEILTEQLEKTLTNQPEAVAVLKQANESMYEMARNLGVGSL